MSSESSEHSDVKKTVENLDSATRQEIEDIVNKLKAANQNDLEALIVVLLEKIIKRMIEEGGGKTDEGLSGPERDDLMEELKLLAKELQQTGKLGSPTEAAQVIYYALHKRFEKLLKKRHEKEKELDKKSMDQIEEELEKMAIYELHKIMNPKQLAGETRLDNFISNMIVGGIELARQYEGGTDKELERYDPELIQDLQAKHESFMQSGGFASNIQKGIGSSKGGGGFSR